MRFADLASTSRALAQTRSRKRKAALLAELLGQLSTRDRLVAVHYLLGSLPQGRIGVGYKAVLAISVAPVSEPNLTIAEVDAAIGDIASVSGKGSVARRQAMLESLFARATSEEQRFLAQVLVGELRQGALDGLMVDGIAEATDVLASLVRRTWMITGDLPGVAALAFDGGAEALAAIELEAMRPVLPMLAQPLEDPGQVFTGGDVWRLETKLDGARIQAHKLGDQVRLFSRSGRDLTGSLPDVAELVAALPVASAIVDGETLSLDADGAPRPFQVTMRRVGRRLGVADAACQQPATARFFDLLSRDGRTLIDRPLRQRLDELFDFLPADLQMDAIETARLDRAEQFFADAIDAGHEGVMLKRLDSPYELGNRGGNWRKWKAIHTIELVVLAAEWGSGRRRGFLSNLHLGARHGDGFAMVGKTFKGLTDKLLAWQTEQLLARQIEQSGHTVWVRPELVVEIAFDGVQHSPRYPGGLALRFARVRRYRDDIDPHAVEALESLRRRLP